MASLRPTACLALLASVAAAQTPAEALQILTSADSERRVAALRALAAAEPTAAVLEAVALALGDPALETRTAAVQTLLTLRPDLGVLRSRLRDIVAPPSRTGTWMLGNVAVRGAFARPGNVRPDITPLGSDDPDIRRAAVVSICSLGPRAASCEADLIAMLADPAADVRAAVAKNIGKIGWNDTIRDAVIGALRDVDAGVRHDAAEGLTEHSEDAGVVAALRGVIQDPDLDVRTQVLRALGRSGKSGKVAASEIVGSLRDREAKVRCAALEAIRELQVRGDRAVRDVGRCLEDEDRKVLMAALETIAPFNVDAAGSLPRVLTLTAHSRAEVRQRALTTSWAVAPAARHGSVALRTVEALQDDDRKIQQEADRLLRAFVAQSR